uniref:Uncharacterized protein n=1 Tax=uncultured bacterium contig00064 TaxID=1181547 RepID=A0A806KI48_9BACT|nr:hypothetical protein [uncultured bacterium contig00064]
MNKALVVAKINLRRIRLAYFLTGLFFVMMLSEYIVAIFVKNPDNTIVSAGNFFILLPLFAAIFIPAKNLRRIINLGGKRDDFFFGCIPVYAILSAAASLVILLFYYTFDRFILNYISGVLDLIWVFGFIGRGPVVAFIQMTVFLMLFSVFIHTLTSIQDKWYGWVTDIMIVAIISVFTPIAPLRAALVWFFRAIIFHQNALFQITFCLLLSAAIYALNRPILARKAI